MGLIKEAITFMAVALICISSTTQAAPSSSIIEPTECPSNQEWTDCGTACPNTCGEPAPMFCTFQCVIGCQCPSGWWQDGEDCVENEIECPFIIEPPVVIDDWDLPLLGGWTGWDEANDEVQNIADEVREAVEHEMDVQFDSYDAESYQSQVVAGWNYRIKINVGGPDLVEILVYKHFSGNIELHESGYDKPECPFNQEWNECGSACPNTCGEPEAKVCTYNCVPECQCPYGWWMQSNGICVEEESQCFPEPECPHNQEFMTCGTACPLTCGEPVPLLCTMQCVIECQCPWGWWKKEDGSCVENESLCDA